MPKTDVSLRINGKLVNRRVDAALTLAQFLNEDLDLTGTKTCCERGICRACTVALAPQEGAPLVAVQSCLLPVAAISGQAVTTIEGLGSPGQLSDLQAAFLRHFAFQCGFSTSGFLMGATVLLDRLRRQPIPLTKVDEAIQDAVGPNLCRCSGYVRYHRAIKEVILATKGLTVSGRASDRIPSPDQSLDTDHA